jgi:hypothetical protein
MRLLIRALLSDGLFFIAEYETDVDTYVHAYKLSRPLYPHSFFFFFFFFFWNQAGLKYTEILLLLPPKYWD